MAEFFPDCAENIVGKGINAGYQHIFLSPVMFPKSLIPRIINPLPNNKILDMTKLNAFADNKLNIVKMTSSFGTVENTVRKGENAGYQHFLLFLQGFSMPSSLGLLKVGIVR